MNEKKLKKILDVVTQEIIELNDIDFENELDEHEDSEIVNMLIETGVFKVGEIESYYFNDNNIAFSNAIIDDLVPSNLEYNASQVVEYYDDMSEQFADFAFSKLIGKNLEFTVSMMAEHCDYFNQK